MFSELFTFNSQDSELENWLTENIGNEFFTDYDPSRLHRHLSKYKKFFNEHELPIVIVGGTNGKGETALYLEKLCVKNNITTYLWSSPHILSVRERFSLAGEPISFDRLLLIFERLKKDTYELSYYEFLLKCFCEYIKETLRDFENSLIIFEVGLGGRLDATNYFDSNLSILTSISRDHTSILGNSLQEILTEKIEICRSGTPLFSSVSQGFLKNKIKDYCEKREVSLIDVDLELNEAQDFHERNLILAQESYAYLHRELFKREEKILPCAVGPVWGRPLKVTYKGCQFILLGSHNLDGLRHLARWAFKVRQVSNVDHFFFSEGFFGFSRQEERELIDCLKILESSPCLGTKRRVIAFDHQRATSESLLKKAFTQLGDSELTGLFLENEFQDIIKNLEENQSILVSGSYYFLSFFLNSLFKLGAIKFS